MHVSGLSLATRYCFPPNAFHLCGPEKIPDLQWYACAQTPDAGTQEILSQFETFSPYTQLIARENNISDPFDERVIEAYWIGNALLRNVSFSVFITHFQDNLKINKRVRKQTITKLFDTIVRGALPHHAFHVTSLACRTGRSNDRHTINSINACIIGWGKVLAVVGENVLVKTNPIIYENNRLSVGKMEITRPLRFQGSDDYIRKSLAPGEWVSSHWGFVCEKLTPRRLRNVIYYTKQSLYYANRMV